MSKWIIIFIGIMSFDTFYCQQLKLNNADNTNVEMNNYEKSRNLLSHFEILTADTSIFWNFN